MPRRTVKYKPLTAAGSAIPTNNPQTLPQAHMSDAEKVLNSCIENVDNTLRHNPKCSTGIMLRKGVFGTLQGPSGGPEILTLIYADDPIFKYWYGHVLRHPEKASTYVAVIVQSDKLVNAPTIPLQFARFAFWVKDRLEYHPSAYQEHDDVYAESESIVGAAAHLSSMISRFDLKKRQGSEKGLYADSPVDLRILEIYGLNSNEDEHGCWKGPPMPSSVRAD